jgi:hypothetical protein
MFSKLVQSRQEEVAAGIVQQCLICPLGWKERKNIRIFQPRYLHFAPIGRTPLYKKQLGVLL